MSGTAGCESAKSRAKLHNDNPPESHSLNFSRGVVARRTPEQYGVVVDSNEAHEEVRQLSSKVKRVIEKKFQKHATSEKQVIEGLRRFGPSAQSKKILNRENDAAVLAMQTGIYALWRCVEPKSIGASKDFCTRVGYKHYCFCGHLLEEHAALKSFRGNVPAPKCEACECRGFNYVPNEPEEIGEGWLTRRREWDPSRWSAKCRCGHGHKEHNPRTAACAQCGCGQYRSNFLCVVCDRDGEAHTTVFEPEHERVRMGLPVREAFFPLLTLDWSLRELVLDDPSGGGALTAPSSGLVAGTDGRSLSSGGERRGGSHLALLPNSASELPQHCSNCATAFRSFHAKFCSNCGKPRK